jgi:hypothetical protein
MPINKKFIAERLVAHVVMPVAAVITAIARVVMLLKLEPQQLNSESQHHTLRELPTSMDLKRSL